LLILTSYHHHVHHFPGKKTYHFPLSFPNISPKEIDDWRHGAVGDHAQAVHGAQTHGVRETHPEGRHEGAILNDCIAVFLPWKW